MSASFKVKKFSLTAISKVGNVVSTYDDAFLVTWTYSFSLGLTQAIQILSVIGVLVQQSSLGGPLWSWRFPQGER